MTGHTAGVEAPEALHRDPFDRLLIVQARHDGVRLLTADARSSPPTTG
jgi:PIN domain nuclease of toxin-antitoxin system